MQKLEKMEVITTVVPGVIQVNLIEGTVHIDCNEYICYRWPWKVE